MRILLSTLACLLLWAPSALSVPGIGSVYGVGHVIVRIENANDLDSALETARRCRDAGLNHVSLRGPLLFAASDFGPGIGPLVKEVHEMGLTASFRIDTFLDRKKGSGQYAWKDWRNDPVGDERLCMVAARKIRVPQIKECIGKGIEAGFDGVMLDSLDWGTEYHRVCFCDACLREFNAFAGTKHSRKGLADALVVGETTIDLWSQWKAKVRNDIARELAEYARKTALRQKRPFWVAQCAGGIGSEPEFCGAIFKVHAPVLSGTASDITRACESWKRRTPKRSVVVAVLEAGTPGADSASLAKAAVSGGADGWLFFPADKLTDDDWTALAEAKP